MQQIKNWFMKWSLRRQKERAIFEIEMDLKYLKTFKGTMIDYDEGKARKRMAELKQIASRTDLEEQELDRVLGVIAESKAVKNEWQKSQALLADLRNYISCL